MEVIVNGVKHTFPTRLNIDELLAALEIEKGTVIVELNEKVVKRDAWLTTIVKAHDMLELVAVVGGG